jgi:hypothetical protein
MLTVRKAVRQAKAVLVVPPPAPTNTEAPPESRCIARGSLDEFRDRVAHAPTVIVALRPVVSQK